MKTMNGFDEEDRRLSAVLRQWRGRAPGPGFEDAVWRRLAVHPEPASARWPGWLSLGNWLGLEPAHVAAMAAMVCILTGLGTDALMARPRADPLASVAPALNGQTLAGAYLAMASGAAR
ncbi:MAG: hypothetical protein KJ579_05505 [Verrucomicrobia bacterium]|nr:hypothetical protein [Verrucomicrobiota bacterium]